MFCTGALEDRFERAKDLDHASGHVSNDHFYTLSSPSSVLDRDGRWNLRGVPCPRRDLGRRHDPHVHHLCAYDGGRPTSRVEALSQRIGGGERSLEGRIAVSAEGDKLRHENHGVVRDTVD
jgi:hypothetical protein